MSDGGAVDHQERRRRIQIQFRGDIDQTDQPRPRAAIIRIIGRWHGRTRQRDPKHTHQLQVQRRHQEERRQETVHRQGAGRKLNNQHSRPRNHNKLRHAGRGG